MFPYLVHSFNLLSMAYCFVFWSFLHWMIIIIIYHIIKGGKSWHQDSLRLHAIDLETYKRRKESERWREGEFKFKNQLNWNLLVFVGNFSLVAVPVIYSWYQVIGRFDRNSILLMNLYSRGDFSSALKQLNLPWKCVLWHVHFFFFLLRFASSHADVFFGFDSIQFLNF